MEKENDFSLEMNEVNVDDVEEIRNPAMHSGGRPLPAAAAGAPRRRRLPGRRIGMR